MRIYENLTARLCLDPSVCHMVSELTVYSDITRRTGGSKPALMQYNPLAGLSGAPVSIDTRITAGTQVIVDFSLCHNQSVTDNKPFFRYIIDYISDDDLMTCSWFLSSRARLLTFHNEVRPSQNIPIQVQWAYTIGVMANDDED